LEFWGLEIRSGGGGGNLRQRRFAGEADEIRAAISPDVAQLVRNTTNNGRVRRARIIREVR
jgi:hypothetical protein